MTIKMYFERRPYGKFTLQFYDCLYNLKPYRNEWLFIALHSRNQITAFLYDFYY